MSMKKSVLFFCLSVLSGSLFFVALLSSVQAYGSESSSGLRTDTDWNGTCTSGSDQTFYDTADHPSFPSSSQSGINYYIETHRDSIGTTPIVTDPKTGKVSGGDTIYGPTHYTQGSSSTSRSCSINVSSSGSVSSGLITHTYYFKSANSTSSTTTMNLYYVTFVDIQAGASSSGGMDHNDGQSTYEDEAPSNVTCTKKYGPSKSVNSQPCALTATSHSVTSTYAKQCYAWTAPFTGVNDSTCIHSYFVQKVTIDSGSSSIYTGIPSKYTCSATFYSWTTPKVLSVTSMDKTWYSTKTSITSAGTNYNMIGRNVSPSDTHNNRYYYTDPFGRSYTIGNSYRNFAINSMMSSDPVDGNYNIYCHYIPKDYMVRYFPLTNNSSQSLNLTNQKTFKSVRNYGIKEMRIRVKGCFNVGNTTAYTCSNTMPGNVGGYLLPNVKPSHWTSTNDEWSQGDFLTGNWYDFKTEIMYTDNSNGTGGGANQWRDITDAPEIEWKYYPNYAVNNSYNTLMPHDGRDHRISGNGKNTIRANFYNNVQTIPSMNRKTTFANDLWAHQVARIIIRGDAGYTSFPKVGSKNATPPNPATEINTAKVNLNDVVQYSAWVIWSDRTNNPYGRGKEENWTKDLIWYGDDMVDKGKYSFVRRGNQDYRTVKVSYADEDGDLFYASGKINKNQWDYAYDKLSVYLEETCAPPYLVVSQCQTPKDNNLTFGFAQGKDNVVASPWYRPGYPTNLPPQLANKYGFPNWDKPNNPYYLLFKFGVTGASNSVADK